MSDQNSFGKLRGLLSQPFTKECWDGLVELVQEWPEGDEKELAFSYFWEHLKDKQKVLQETEKPSKNNLLGLWKCTYVRQESGTLDTSAEIDYGTIDEVREFETEKDRDDS